MTDNPHAPHPRWLWVSSCTLCGWRSPRFDSENIARGLALLHAVIRHPYGHTTIAAVDRRTALVNDAMGLPGGAGEAQETPQDGG